MLTFTKTAEVQNECYLYLPWGHLRLYVYIKKRALVYLFLCICFVYTYTNHIYYICTVVRATSVIKLGGLKGKLGHTTTDC